MREILFRAKRKLDGAWIVGDLSQHKNGKKFIKLSGGSATHSFEVDENTICQYTGLTDKNGDKIWENDILFVTDGDGCSGSSDTGVGEIDFLLGLWYISGSIQNGLYDVLEVIGHEAEVIGNIFDNPKLLERN